MEQDIKRVFGELVAVDAPSLKEKQMAEQLVRLFGELGIRLEEDDSGEKSGSDTGNLYGYVQGEPEADTVLLSAHMDTVMPACGKKAVFAEDGTVTSDGTTVLGADDLAGITAIYEAVKYVREKALPHRSFELLFTTGEELYGRGANAFNCGRLRAGRAYVLDLTGPVGDAAYAAPSILSFRACIRGRASHAGFEPEAGISAIAAAARGIAALRQGRIDEETTANIGVISGGEGVNVVAPECVVKGEVRSLKHEKALALLKEYQACFEEAAKAAGAELEWEESVDIRAYETPPEGAAAEAYRAAVKKAGCEARLYKTFGGSDNNVFALHGIEGLVIASAMNRVHTCREYSSIHEIAKVAEIVIHLLTL